MFAHQIACLIPRALAATETKALKDGRKAGSDGMCPGAQSLPIHSVPSNSAPTIAPLVFRYLEQGVKGNHPFPVLIPTAWFTTLRSLPTT